MKLTVLAGLLALAACSPTPNPNEITIPVTMIDGKPSLGATATIVLGPEAQPSSEAIVIDRADLERAIGRVEDGAIIVEFPE